MFTRRCSRAAVLLCGMPVAACAGSRPPTLERVIRPASAPEVREGLERRALLPFASEDAACTALYQRVQGLDSDQVGGACAPFATRRTCHLVQDPRGSAAMLEVGVVETVPTEHCADYPGAPRADVQSAIIAPATVSRGELRVGVESLVHAPHVSTMVEGLRDGVARLEDAVLVGNGQDADWVHVFRAESTSCVRSFSWCDHDLTWCTVPTDIGSCDVATPAPKLRFDRDSTGMRVTVGGAPGVPRLYALSRSPMGDAK